MKFVTDRSERFTKTIVGKNMTIRTFAIAVLLATISNAALGQAIERIEIIDFGIYNGTETKGKAADWKSGLNSIAAGTETLVGATNVVPLNPEFISDFTTA